MQLRTNRIISESRKKMHRIALFFSFCQTNFSYLDEMYAEVCAYLTTNKYFELPNYCVSINKTNKDKTTFNQLLEAFS